MPITPIIPPGSPPPLAPYSPGTRAGDWLFVSGTLAIGPGGETVGVGDVAAQTRHVLESIRSVVEAAGGTLANVVFNQIFLKDLTDYAAMNKVYGEFFQGSAGRLLHPRRSGEARIPRRDSLDRLSG